MDLSTVEIPRKEARQSYVEYRRQAKIEADPDARRELEEMAQAFRLAAKTELALIALTPTIARGGTVVRTLVHDKGRDTERRNHYLLPRLAVTRSDAQFVFTRGIQRDGSVEFIDRVRPWHNYRKGIYAIAAGFELPADFVAGENLSNAWYSTAWAAQVPIVPPKLRPRGGHVNLSNYATLWEVDDWQWMRDPAPACDPALLRHVAGDIYAVVATWDLTELERLVLSGRRLAS
jgi:hypothetical protein